jgi:hypothetical protein
MPCSDRKVVYRFQLKGERAHAKQSRNLSWTHSVPKMLDRVTTSEIPLAESTEREPQADADSEAAEFKSKVRFMFMIPAAVFVFLGVCAAAIALSP